MSDLDFSTFDEKHDPLHIDYEQDGLDDFDDDIDLYPIVSSLLEREQEAESSKISRQSELSRG